MTAPEIDSRQNGIAQRVRANAFTAAIAAALLIYFGCFHLSADQGGGLFGIAATALVWTLRIGGVAFALLALLSLTGQLFTLAIDAVVSIAVGIMLVLTGIGLLVGGGGMLQPVISVVCAWLFIGAGVRNWRDFRLVSGHKVRAYGPHPQGYDPRFEERYQDAQAAPPPASLASQLRERAEAPPPAGNVTYGDTEAATGPGSLGAPLPSQMPAGSAQWPEGDASLEPSIEDPDAADAASLSERTEDTEAIKEEPNKGEPAPDGFLSSFADEDTPRGV
ncbi:MAG: hypothetical protein JSV78_13680 [Phycisphaerales bacterium]|nr:MAG: hypothetical protein JSV78_13680 [Phycisphaerales bacterium]